MSPRFSALRAAAATAAALAWAAACGGADSASTSGRQCFIYYGGGFPRGRRTASPFADGVCKFSIAVRVLCNPELLPHYDAASNSVIPRAGPLVGR